MLKFVQRRTYSFLNTWSGFGLIVILTYALLAYTITVLFYDPCSNSNGVSCNTISNSRRSTSSSKYHDNIGNIDTEVELAYGPIDVGNCNSTFFIYFILSLYFSVHLGQWL